MERGEVRPIKAPGLSVYLIPLLPFAVGLIVFGWRRSKSGKRKGSFSEA